MARPKGKREDIIQSATHIFANKGFHLTNINEIAEQAGIGKGTVYEYFNSKSDLFLEVMTYNVDKYLLRIQEAILSKEGFQEKLLAYIDTHQAIIGENYHITGLFISTPAALSTVADNGKEVMSILCGARDKTVKLVEDILILGAEEGILHQLHLDYYSDLFFEMVNKTSLRVFQLELSESEMLQEKECLISFLLKGIGK